MSGLAWSKFFWSDWASDPKLRLCSAAAQGLWMRMLCICAEADGYLTINGRPLGHQDLAAITGWPQHDVENWLAELGQWDVFSIDRKGRVYSRRMVADVKKAKTSRKNGKNGGNPNLRKQRGSGEWVNPKPTPPLSPRSQKPDTRKNSEEDKPSSAPDGAVIDLDKLAWDEAVEALAKDGRTEKAARSLFGRLLKEHGLRPMDLLPSLSRAHERGTHDAASYLSACAATLARRRSDEPPKKRVGFV